MMPIQWAVIDDGRTYPGFQCLQDAEFCAGHLRNKYKPGYQDRVKIYVYQEVGF